MTEPTAAAAARRFSPATLPAGQRVAVCVQYGGSGFCGWQAQPQLPGVSTIQGEVERALGVVMDAPLRVHCAGRTDTGVHALAQWVHFDLPVARSPKACVVGVNAQLPPAIRITAALPVPGDFHARHSAEARSYTYLIANTPVAPALLAERALWVREPLDVSRMHASLQPLLGEQDFSAFRAAACQSRTPMRNLMRAAAVRDGDYLQVRLTANAFLHHMVRNIVGALLVVGRGDAGEDWPAQLLAGRDRTRAAPTAPPHGLYLTEIAYPARFAIPAAQASPLLRTQARD